MTTSTMNQIAAEIAAYIRQCGGGYLAWYVGIASDVKDRLFSDHAVREKGDSWIYRHAGSDTAARAIEQHFLNLGCKGGPGGGDATTAFVYAYAIQSHTVE